ncbi:MAG: DUF6596 domain-containing protein [Betaproteobacteria bacterium]
MSAVLDAIYGAYGIGTNVAVNGLDGGVGGTWSELTREALFLGALVAHLLPDNAEASGLLALMRHCEARRPAQFDAGGRFVPLVQQDTTLWDRALMAAAEAALLQAAGLRQPGPFQLEAAIQSAHSQRAFTGHTPWPAIAALYAALVEHFPSTGALIGCAVARADAGRLRLLGALASDEVAGYQPYWIVLAYLSGRTGQGDALRRALERALGLTADERIRRYLQAVAATGRWIW